jgi:hypothetical protein
MVGDESQAEPQPELIEAELADPAVAAAEAELAESYEERREAEAAEAVARREQRQAEHHQRAAEEHEQEAEAHRERARRRQQEVRSGDGVTIEADVVEEELLDDEPAGDDTAPVDEAAAARAPRSENQVVRLEDTIDALPALARLAAGAWLRATAWGLGTSVRMGARLARAATDPDAAVELYGEVTSGMRAYAREFLGVSDIDERLRQLAPLAGSSLARNGNQPDLRARGEELLRQAADVGYDQAAHPAYARILSELAPDEARILRLLAIEGPQPLVDVRAQNLIGVGSQLVTPGLNMVGPQAGVRWRERVPAYLNNLGRLGLIFVSDEAVKDPIAYQVLEAQPDVLGVIKETSRAKTVHRSLRLTPFGQDFCSMCLPLEGGVADELPEPQAIPQRTSN